MDLITTIPEMKAYARRARSDGRKLALVPTMGALHEGHFSLVRRAKAECHGVIISIFVNPTQFAAGEDLARYPRDLTTDLLALDPLGADVVFAPSTDQMYPQGLDTFVEPGRIAVPLEGACRPGHFRGVATVVLKLFNIVNPDIAYFGQKDFQQTLVIRQLIRDLNLDVQLVVCPIVREPDGLAASSRNVYLSAANRQAALALYHSLRRALETFRAGETRAGEILNQMHAALAAQRELQVDYTVLVEPSRLDSVEVAAPGCVALVAGRVGDIRLIDNAVLGSDAT
jgi:pantoate--beta-alanine ligase